MCGGDVVGFPVGVSAEGRRVERAGRPVSGAGGENHSPQLTCWRQRGGPQVGKELQG